MTALPPQHRCPQCGAQTIWQGNPDRPFCSERCRMIDLGRWAAEEYRVPVAEHAGLRQDLPD